MLVQFLTVLGMIRTGLLWSHREGPVHSGPNRLHFRVSFRLQANADDLLAAVDQTK